jgi:EAL domain-containing protein (putative c-di-GMP-specific phosphodiesterase class I)
MERKPLWKRRPSHDFKTSTIDRGCERGNHTLKIDRSFVTDLATGPEGRVLVSAIIKLAHSLKLNVVAEGVETEQQSSLLRSMRCDEMQGFLISVPLSSRFLETRYVAPARPATVPHRLANSSARLT